MDTKILIAAFSIAVAGCATGALVAQDQGQQSQDEMMQQYLDAVKPGEEHKRLDPLVGKWDAEVRYWGEPGAEPTTSTGTMETEWILDGRYLKQDYKGEFFGQEFHGMGLVGYNKVAGEYESLWLDNFGTGMMKGAGQASSDGKTFTFHSTFDDAMTNSEIKTRDVLKIESKDKHSYTSYAVGPGGEETKVMELVYTRAKN